MGELLGEPLGECFTQLCARCASLFLIHRLRRFR
jgi:hypothetical protein